MPKHNQSLIGKTRCYITTVGTPNTEPAFLEKVEDYCRHYKDNIRRALRVEGPCITAVEFGELLAVLTGKAGYLAVRAGFGIVAGTGIMTVTLTGDEEMEERESKSAYGEFKKSYEALKLGAKRVYDTCMNGTKHEKEKLKRDLKRNAETAIFGELFGCVGVSAITEAAIISALGGGLLAWGASLIPTYIIGSAVVASKLAYDEYREQKVVGRLSLPEGEAEEFAEILGKEYSYSEVKRDKNGRTRGAEFNLRDGTRALFSRSKIGSDGRAIITLKVPKLRYDNDAETKGKYEEELKSLLGEAVEILGAEIRRDCQKHH